MEKNSHQCTDLIDYPFKYWLISKVISMIFILVLFFLISGCTDNEYERYDEKKHYKDQKLEVVQTANPVMEKDGKYMVEVKKILVRRVEDTTMHAELSNLDWNKFLTIKRHNEINKNHEYNGLKIYYDSIWYNSKKGDILYFKYIGKWRFFHITRPLNDSIK